ncbi:MAG: hypothetical protein M0R21_07515 [Lentimicrobiaceae bacterium]|nr:hypothetical protein [Lentimicrobiaceae bacterium]
MEKYIGIAKDIALHVGKTLKRQYNDNSIKINTEEGRDIKLQSDIDSEKLIIDILMDKTEFSILSEECGFIEGTKKDYLWVIDPLDGSLNFSRGIEINCISIGLWKDVSPVLGVIYNFINENMYEGICGKGAFLDGKSIYVSGIKEKSKSIICTGFPVYRSFEDDSLISFLSKIQSYKKVRLLGSAAYSLALLAKGSVEAYSEESIGIWDVAAGIAIVKAAGGICDYTFCEENKNLLNVFVSNI